jgi:hypothetical protein
VRIPAADLGVVAAGSGLVGAAPGFTAKLQGAGDVRLEVAWPVGTVVSLGFDFLMAGALASDAAGWFAYRGWGGWGLEALGRATWQVAGNRQKGWLRTGAELAAGAALLHYASTTLYFFSPTVQVAGLLQYTPASLPYLDFTLSVPVRAWLRTDLSYSISAGLGLGCSFSTSRYGVKP